MPNIKLICPICDEEFEKRKAEYNRSERKGRPHYCSLKCAGKANQHSLGNNFGIGRPENLIPDNRKDEYSQFKWYIRCVRRRNKNHDIDLKFLKDLWDEQQGICPITGWKLNLPKNSTYWDEDQNRLYRASLDRIDSSLGYIRGNVRFISVMANYCKNDFADEDVFAFCEAVVQNKTRL